MLKNKKGFTFIELSVVILIVSILFAGTSVIFSKIRGTAQTNETKARLKEIEKALKVYFLENGFLPCPAGLLLTEFDDDFGTGSCTENATNGIYLSNDLLYGAVPFVDLGIAPDFSFDGWNNKFSYIVDNNFNTETDFEQNSDNLKIIINNVDSKIDDDTDGDVMDEGDDDEIVKRNAILVIISHGLDGQGAYRKQLRNILPTDGGSDKYDQYDNIFVASFDNNFVDNIKTSNFDDILKAFDRNDFIKGVGIEEIGCLIEDITTYTYDMNGSDTDISWPTTDTDCPNGLCPHEQELMASDSCNSGDYPNHYFSRNTASPFNPAKKCLKNGRWSDIMFECEQGCGQANILTILNNLNTGNETDYTLDNIDNDDSSDSTDDDMDDNLWQRVGLDEEVVLRCTDGKTGYVTLKCQTDGTWIGVSGNCSDEANEFNPTP
jgi:prepilin-type N-terminal cleavage/methylation domain-containing protein